MEMAVFGSPVAKLVLHIDFLVPGIWDNLYLVLDMWYFLSAAGGIPGLVDKPGLKTQLSSSRPTLGTLVSKLR